MEEVSSLLFQRLTAVMLAAAFGIFISRIAWLKGYFQLPIDDVAIQHLPRWKHVIQAFALFLILEMILAPVLYSVWIYLQTGTMVELNKENIPIELKSWANIVIICITTIALVAYFASLNKHIRDAIWGSPPEIRGPRKNALDFLMGSLTWVIAYPWILVNGQLVAIIVAIFYHGPHPDQAPVQHLKDIFEKPLLFGITALTVVTIIPFIEELLFRGFLQSGFKAMIGRTKAIILTSFIFAMFHFSFSQGIENIEFISSLFLLSCFLGFIKERQRSLWASIGLHSTFNFVSILMLTSELAP